MIRKNVLLFIMVLIIFALASSVVLPIGEGVLGGKGIHLGLDLVGGSHLVYQAQFPEETTVEEKARAMDRALDTIRTRIDKYGVLEPVIQEQEGERILVQLPAFTDIEEAKNLVEQTGYLELREVELDDDGKPVYLSHYLETPDPEFFDEGEEGTRIFVDENDSPVAFLTKEGDNLTYTDEAGNPIDVEELKQGSTQLLSWIPARGKDDTPLTGSFLEAATPLPDERAGAITAMKVGIVWDGEGGVIFDDIAERLYSRPYGSPQRAIGFFLDNVLISQPHIEEPAYQGSGEISSPAGFTIEEASRLANLFESGALPMPLRKPPLYEEVVSATRGALSVEMGIKAGVIGIILVMLFMIIYYRLPGLLASLALIFYGVLVLAVFKLWPGGGVTLTLAGICGFVLSIGMAVDANVLIFERVKEELRTGRTLGAAIETGFNRAWTAIRDSNVTTFIVCGILYWVGSRIIAGAPVMGFALTLFIGVAASMFTAIMVTRTLLRLFVGTRLARQTSLFSVYSWKK